MDNFPANDDPHRLCPEFDELSAELSAQVKGEHGRDRLFEAIAVAAKALLTLDDLEEAIDSALKAIMAGLDCDRMRALEHSYDPSSALPRSSKVIYECLKPGIVEPGFAREAVQIDCTEIDRVFLEKYFLNGNGFGGLVEEWNEPLRSNFAASHIQSAHAVPIQVNGRSWGVLCLGYSRAAIRISPAQVAALRTIADCIGSAIQRDRTQKLLLHTEQQQVIELAKTNAVLRQSLDVLARDRDLDRFIGHILGVIAHQFDSPLTEYWVASEEGERRRTINLIYRDGQVLPAAELPDHPGLTGVSVSSEVRQGFDRDNLQSIEQWLGGADWYAALGVTRCLDIPLTLGEITIGSLAIFLPQDRPAPRPAIELARALAQPLTLAIELTRLGEESRQMQRCHRSDSARRGNLETLSLIKPWRENLLWFEVGTLFSSCLQV